MTLEAEIREGFERLAVGDLRITSDICTKYNCIAWAMGDPDNFWWPDGEDGYWPAGVEVAETVDAFIAAFATKGFTPCDDGSPVEGKEKVALFTKKGKPTHASYLMSTGEWASKLGRDHDVVHITAPVIGGLRYGDPTHFFERPIPAEPRPIMPNTKAEWAAKVQMTNATAPAVPASAKVSSKGAGTKGAMHRVGKKRL